jgi:hypothetical protein
VSRTGARYGMGRCIMLTARHQFGGCGDSEFSSSMETSTGGHHPYSLIIPLWRALKRVMGRGMSKASAFANECSQ